MSWENGTSECKLMRKLKSSLSYTIFLNSKVILISVGQLQDKGLDISIQHDICKIYHPVRGLFMQTKMSSNKTFVLLASAPTNIQDQACFQITFEDRIIELWHQRFGCLNMKGLRILAYRKMVEGLPIVKASNKVCASCVIKKKHRDLFLKKSLWSASKPLQLVHSDICGPITLTQVATRGIY